MKLTYIEDGNEDFLCSRYRIKQPMSTAALLEALDALAKEKPDFRFLMTLDFFPQACYTSMHAKMTHELDSTEGFDLSGLPAECFEEGEHLGYLTHKAEFFIQKANYERRLDQVSFDSLCDKQIGLYSEGDNETPAFERDLASVVDDREAYILEVPVTEQYETIYAFPNGYFQPDLNPMENLKLAQRMAVDYDYHLIGIGSEFLAYRRRSQLDEQSTSGLIDMLAKIYRDNISGALAGRLRDCIQTNDILLLRYQE